MKNSYNFFWRVEVQLQPNLICRCSMKWTSNSVSGWGLFYILVFFFFFFWVFFFFEVFFFLGGGGVTMVLEFPASYCHLAREIAQVNLLYFGSCERGCEPLTCLGKVGIYPCMHICRWSGGKFYPVTRFYCYTWYFVPYQICKRYSHIIHHGICVIALQRMVLHYSIKHCKTYTYNWRF